MSKLPALAICALFSTAPLTAQANSIAQRAASPRPPIDAPAPLPTGSPTPAPQSMLDDHKRQMIQFERKAREKKWAFDDQVLKENRALEDEKRKALRDLERKMDDEVARTPNPTAIRRDFEKGKQEIDKQWRIKEDEHRTDVTRRRKELSDKLAKERQEVRLDLKD